MAERVSQLLGEAVNPWGYVLLFALTALEASAFVGLFVPGETALLFGGFLAYQGKLNLALVIVVTVIGGILGDSAGYEIGRHLGDRMKRTWLGRKIGPDRWERARTYVRDKGGRAVLLGRFVGILRALVPAVAGDSRMPYATFLLWNMVGALLWGPSVVVAGYLAGRSWRVIETYLSRGGLILFALLIVGFVVLHLLGRRRKARAKTGAGPPAAG
jgi:membrane protein DedA with SNARE-associated domain